MTVTEERFLSPEAVVAARAALGLTQQQLAVTLRVSVPTVSRWETGRARAPYLLGLALEWLRGQQSRKKTPKGEVK